MTEPTNSAAKALPCDAPAAVIACVDAFANANGRTWRAKLRRIWKAGTDTGQLRQARNIIGPRSLDDFKPGCMVQSAAYRASAEPEAPALAVSQQASNTAAAERRAAEIKTVADALDAVASLIGEPSRWTVEAEALDAAGMSVEPLSPYAAAWSLGGAIERVIDPDATDITDAEWQRRTDLEQATYRALGITTDRADGGLSDHGVTVLVVRDARARLAA